MRVLGLPCQTLLASDVLIPNPVEVSELLSGLATELPNLTGSEPAGAELWRRLTLGQPDSQNHASLGTIPNLPLPYLPPHRIRSKQSAEWVRQVYQSRSFLSLLRSSNDLGLEVFGTSLATHLQQAGVCSLEQLREYGKRCTMRATRARSILAFVSRGGSHVTDSASGIRFLCASCSKSPPLSHALRWLSRPCPQFDPVKAHACSLLLEEAALTAQRLAESVKTLSIG